MVSDELGSGLVLASITNTVETTTVVMREVEVVPPGAGAYFEQEAVVESKSTSSVDVDDSEERYNTEIRECAGGICSTGIKAQRFEGLMPAAIPRGGSPSPVSLKENNIPGEVSRMKRYHTTRGARITDIGDAWRAADEVRSGLNISMATSNTETATVVDHADESVPPMAIDQPNAIESTEGMARYI